MTKLSLIHFGFSLLMLVVVGVCYFFWYGMVTDMRTEVAEIAANAEAATVAAGDIAAARSALSKLAEDEQFFGSYFVSTTTVVAYLEKLEDTGSDLGALVEVVSVNPEGTNRLAVSFRAEGAFSSVMRTLGAIEFGPYDAVMRNMTIETTLASEGRWIATGVVSVGMNSGEARKPAAPAPAPAEDPLI